MALPRPDNAPCKATRLTHAKARRPRIRSLQSQISPQRPLASPEVRWACAIASDCADSRFML